MNYDEVTVQSYFHRNLVAALIAAVLVVAIVVGGVIYRDRQMLNAGYVWVFRPEVPAQAGWVKP